VGQALQALGKLYPGAYSRDTGRGNSGEGGGERYPGAGAAPGGGGVAEVVEALARRGAAPHVAATFGAAALCQARVPPPLVLLSGHAASLAPY